MNPTNALIGQGNSIFAGIVAIANEYTISPYTVIGQVNKYAEYSKQSQIKLSKAFYGAVTNFNKNYKTLSEALFDITSSDDGGPLNGKDYISISEESFETPFFGMLRQYLKLNKKGSGFVQTVLDTSLLDARSIHTELA